MVKSKNKVYCNVKSKIIDTCKVNKFYNTWCSIFRHDRFNREPYPNHSNNNKPLWYRDWKLRMIR